MAEVSAAEHHQGPLEGDDITYMDMAEETEALGDSEIRKFLAGSTIFLTGGTGFIGKLLVEKLLRSCPEIRRIYLLARPKKNKEMTRRLQEQFDDILYERLKKEQPDFIQKIQGIEGDIGLVGLGLNDENRQLLSDEVDIIFHGAATVRFDETLKTAVEINVRGTKEMIQLAHNCKKLRAFVHTSTAYSYCPLKHIEEKFYNSPIPADNLIDLVENVSEKTLNDITKGLIGDHPNTYVYTKAVAEDAILKYGKGLPVAMVRPSIIIGTAKEPVSGWIDNIYGPTGIVVGASLGLLHTMRAKSSMTADMVPGDMVVNTIIAAAWNASRGCHGNEEDVPCVEAEPTVYNYVSGTRNPITWEKFMQYNERYGFQTPPVKTIWYYLLMLNESKFAHVFWSILLHWIPAYIVDGILVLIGKKPMLRKAYRKIHKFSHILSYFSMNEWKFDDSNTENLYRSLNKADKDIYGFNIPVIEWNSYFSTYMKGVRMYLLKDPVETIPEGRSRFMKLRIAHYSLVTLVLYLLFQLFWKTMSVVLLI